MAKILELVGVLNSLLVIPCNGYSQKDFIFAFTVSGTAAIADLNVTALQGQDAKLPCSIDSLNDNITVVWMDKHDNVLYFNENRMIDDMRFAMSKLDRNWDLVIRKVDARDEGSYRCVANTVPIKLKYYQLTVFVPPKVNLETSSVDVDAPEGTSVILYCNVTGHPSPTITWSKRKAVEPKNSTNAVKLPEKGDTLVVRNVSRYSDEIYTCSASNGHGSPDHHEIRIRVRYKPEVKTMQAKVSRYQGENAELSCIISGYEKPIMYFAKDNYQVQQDITNHKKYMYNSAKLAGSHDIQMNLTVYNLQDDDFGYYRCVAVNSLDRVEKYIELKELKPQTTPSLTSTMWSNTPEIDIYSTSLSPLTDKQTRSTAEVLKPQLQDNRKNLAAAEQSTENSADERSIQFLSWFLLTVLIYTL